MSNLSFKEYHDRHYNQGSYTGHIAPKFAKYFDEDNLFLSNQIANACISCQYEELKSTLKRFGGRLASFNNGELKILMTYICNSPKPEYIHTVAKYNQKILTAR